MVSCTISEITSAASVEWSSTSGLSLTDSISVNGSITQGSLISGEQVLYSIFSTLIVVVAVSVFYLYPDFKPIYSPSPLEVAVLAQYLVLGGRHQ